MRHVLWAVALCVGGICAMSDAGDAQGLPPEVTRLSAGVEAVPGVSDAQVRKLYLPQISVDDLSLPGIYADLPIASLRRSGGALEDEVLMSLDFWITRDETGLKALEFLAWWVRDQSRSGQDMQLRAMGLPPIAGNTVQLGSTLRFTIDWFYLSEGKDLDALLRAIDAMAGDLEQSLNLYVTAFSGGAP